MIKDEVVNEITGADGEDADEGEDAGEGDDAGEKEDTGEAG